MKYKLVRFLPWTGFIAIALIIFLFSSNTANTSNDISKSLAARILDIFNLGSDASSVRYFNSILRKAAHFLLFMFMGIFVHVIAEMNIRNTAFRILASEISGVFFAVLDETHQAFVPGRSPQITDVMIDSCGFTVGVMIVCAVYVFFRKRRKRLDLKT